MKELELTFSIEIKRLYDIALERPLKKEEVDKLVKLTSAWKSYSSNPIQEEIDPLENLNDDELLELARSNNVEDSIKS